MIAGTAALGLTACQRWVLLIVQELSRDGVPPTLAEIAHELGCDNRSKAKYHVERLKERGYLAATANSARSLVVLRCLPMPEEAEIVGFFTDAALAAQATA